MNPYPAYKPSGVPWLGDVPEHWHVRRTKTLLVERSQKGFPDEPLLAATQTKGVVRKEDYDNRTVLALKDLHLLKLVRVGDFVISLRSFQGGIEYAREQGIISPAYTVLYARNPDTHTYLAWLFKSRSYIENLTLHVTGIRQGQNIDYEKLSRSYLPLPPMAEQAAIVRYLDHADRRIRRYVDAKRKLIALLEEEKQAIVSQVVTRGLDPNVPLKPSGIEWLGDVPEHWQAVKLRRCVSVSGGMTPSMEVHRFWNGLVPWVTPKDMKQAVISNSSVKVTDAAIQETSLQLIEPPVVLMVVRGMILARRVPIASITTPVTINQDMKALKALRGCLQSLELVLNLMNEPQIVPQRPDGRTVGDPRPPTPTSQTRRPAPYSGPAGGSERHPVFASERMPLADGPARSVSLADPVQVLPQLDHGWNVGTSQ